MNACNSVPLQAQAPSLPSPAAAVHRHLESPLFGAVVPDRHGRKKRPHPEIWCVPFRNFTNFSACLMPTVRHLQVPLYVQLFLSECMGSRYVKDMATTCLECSNTYQPKSTFIHRHAFWYGNAFVESFPFKFPCFPFELASSAL